MQSVKEEVSPQEWALVHSSKSICWTDSGAKFTLKVVSRFKARLGPYTKTNAAKWVASLLQELNRSWLLVK